MTNSSSPLVTFALFAYNQGQFIREAVQGAFSQDYPFMEIVISDDCSTDNTFEIIEELVRDYKGPHKLIINRNPRNIGLVASVNKVFIEIAHGEWFVTAAGDDVSLPTRVTQAMAIAKSDVRIKGVHCAVDRVDEGGNFLNALSPRKVDLKNIENESMLGAAACYHRDVMDVFGPMSNSVQNEDMVLTLRALLIGHIHSLDESCVVWRRHGNNISGKIGRSAMDQVRFLYCEYVRRRVSSTAQQMCDTLSEDKRITVTEQELTNLQKRLLHKTRADWQLSIFAKWMLDSGAAPLSVKLKPINWFTILRYILAQHISMKFPSIHKLIHTVRNKRMINS